MCDLVHRGTLHLQIEQQNVAGRARDERSYFFDGFHFADHLDLIMQA